MSFVRHYNTAAMIGELADKTPEFAGVKKFVKKASNLGSGPAPALYLSLKVGEEYLLIADATDKDVFYLEGALEDHKLFEEFKSAFYADNIGHAATLLTTMIKEHVKAA